MGVRSRREEARYQKYLKSLPADKGCDFCAISPADEQFITETINFKVIKNLFPYAQWDSRPVSDHLMVVPKQHTDTLKEVGAQASEEYLSLVSDYESQGYNIYARAPGSTQKSIIHQHTHLIKLNYKEPRQLISSIAKSLSRAKP